MWKGNKDSLFNDNANIFVKNIDSKVTQHQLHDDFSEHGSIKSCKLQTWPNGESKGFGFIQYEKEEEAKAAISAMDRKNYHGKQLSVCFFKKKGERQPGVVQFTNLFVKNINTSALDENKLKTIFSNHGQITSFHYDSEKKFAFVNYNTHNEAQSAINALNG